MSAREDCQHAFEPLNGNERVCGRTLASLRHGREICGKALSAEVHAHVGLASNPVEQSNVLLWRWPADGLAGKPCDDFQEPEPPAPHYYADEKCARCGEMRCDHEP